MARIINQVAVFGLGKVGELVALLLADAGFKVVGLDAEPRPLLTADGVELEVRPLDVTDDAGLRESLRGVDAVVSCLPYHLQHHGGRGRTRRRRALLRPHRGRAAPPSGSSSCRAAAPESAFAPQCGLAPGLIGIVGASLAEEFDEIRSIELKVGALPQNPTGLLGYAFNWSPEGVVNEYLNDCEVLRSGRRQMVPAMTEKERVLIGGIELEAALTSGGLGTMCETYEGRVNRLDYKTMRYPGHFRQMHFLFDELNLRDQRDLIGRLLVDAKPPVNDDIVYLHAAVEGVKAGPAATARTTCAATCRSRSAAGCGGPSPGRRRPRRSPWSSWSPTVVCPPTGFIKQEDILLSDLLDTRAGRLFDHSTITQSERA